MTSLNRLKAEITFTRFSEGTNHHLRINHLPNTEKTDNPSRPRLKWGC